MYVTHVTKQINNKCGKIKHDRHFRILFVLHATSSVYIPFTWEKSILVNNAMNFEIIRSNYTNILFIQVYKKLESTYLIHY